MLAVDLDELVVTHAGQQRRTRISTVAQVAAFAGIKPGAPQQVYQPTTALEPDAELRIDRQAAQLLADWYQLGSRALVDFAAAVPENEPTPAQLWPEHFDLGATAARVNYGVSPGDVHIGEPYLYVGPFDGPPSGGDEFWNAPFGAMVGSREVTSVKAAADFFHDGTGAAVSTHPVPAKHSGAHHERTCRQARHRHRRQLRDRAGLAVRLGAECVDVAINYVGRSEGAEATKDQVQHGVDLCMKQLSVADANPILVEADVSDAAAVNRMFTQANTPAQPTA